MPPVDLKLQKADLAKEVKPRFIDQLHVESDQFQQKMQQMLGGVT